MPGEGALKFALSAIYSREVFSAVTNYCQRQKLLRIGLTLCS